MVKVGWMHDFRLSEHGGGAQLTNDAIVQAAPDWAEVECYYPGEVGEADLYILNNVKFFSFDELKRAVTGRFLIFEHDLWDTPQDWQRQLIGPMFRRALGAVFLSPLHWRAFVEHHKVTPHQVALCPSPVDPTLFGPPKEDRKNAVWLGTFHAHKGIKAAEEWARHYGPLDFYGWGPQPPQGPGVRVCGRLDYAQVPAVLRGYERFVFMPQWNEPFGRTVAEAVFSGCELVCNNNIGAMSWGWRNMDEWREGCTGAPERFWNIVEEWL